MAKKSSKRPAKKSKTAASKSAAPRKRKLRTLVMDKAPLGRSVFRSGVKASKTSSAGSSPVSIGKADQQIPSPQQRAGSSLLAEPGNFIVTGGNVGQPPRSAIEMTANQTLDPLTSTPLVEIIGKSSVKLGDHPIKRATIFQRMADASDVLPRIDNMIDILGSEIERLTAASDNLDGPASVRAKFSHALQNILDGLIEIRDLLRRAVTEKGPEERMLKGKAAEIADKLYDAYAKDWAKNGPSYAGITINMGLAVAGYWIADLAGAGAFVAGKYLGKKKTKK